ncbi:MAG: GxxExxY protein [Wenzhouxiangellaceae bacterium]|nr:GxxExxY protein [Wenzhouxiangellaceae bacterium]
MIANPACGTLRGKPAAASRMTTPECRNTRLEAVASLMIDEAVRLHRALGPGLLESVYETALSDALRRRGLQVDRQRGISIRYRGSTFENAFRADLVVEGIIILEIKSIERVTPTHRKQLITYLRLSGLHLGFLLNFGSALMKDGIVRVVDRLPE